MSIHGRSDYHMMLLPRVHGCEIPGSLGDHRALLFGPQNACGAGSFPCKTARWFALIPPLNP